MKVKEIIWSGEVGNRNFDSDCGMYRILVSEDFDQYTLRDELTGEKYPRSTFPEARAKGDRMRKAHVARITEAIC